MGEEREQQRIKNCQRACEPKQERGPALPGDPDAATQKLKGRSTDVVTLW